MTESPGVVFAVVGRTSQGTAVALLDDDTRVLSRVEVVGDGLPATIERIEATESPRWVWSDTARWYAPLLEAGVRVARCHDLRLCHVILRTSARVDDAAEVRHPSEWDAPATVDAPPAGETLFDLEGSVSGPLGVPGELESSLEEFARQRAAIASSPAAGSLRLLLAAESAGALIAAEMRAAGLPWDAAAHEAILTAELGARPRAGGIPDRVEAAAARVRDALGDPRVSLDSQPKLLRALHRAGLPVHSTSKWELAEQRHPVVEPLLEYKRLSRLMSANGWAWLDEWVRDGRFRPVYVPGGVVTGRWASSGGGALQLPRQLRAAVCADPGWTLVVADVAQLEPRVLAAMSHDRALADAARGRDLYAGIVESGAVATRADAKIAMLGAMYGATTGESGRLVPRLRRTFRQAMGLVDEAARTGEDGGVVSTWLGRSSPAASPEWSQVQSRATEAEASSVDVTRARRWAGDRGRFTRNFVVQGTAAEWALAWLADVRTRLAAMPPAQTPAPRSGSVAGTRPHLAFFLHDEIIVHTPAERADEVAGIVQESATSAGRLLFGGFPIDFPLDVRISATALKD